MHLYGFRKTDGLARQTFNPCPSCEMLSLNVFVSCFYLFHDKRLEYGVDRLPNRPYKSV
jgi:hypothetical protein